MKKILVALFIFYAYTSSADIEKSITDSDIKDVKVYLSGAVIKRTFKTNLQSGVTRLAVENLSSQILNNSITVTASGEAMILSTNYSLDYIKEKKEPQVLKGLRDSLDLLSGESNELNMVKSVYVDEVAMLNANKSVGGSNVGVNSENLKKVIDFYRVRMIEVKGKILEVDKKLVKLADRIKRLNEQIEVENGKMKTPFGTIFVNVSAQQSETVSFEISYFAQGASWRPSYDLRANDVKSPVNLVYKALVSQNTGENWEKVHIELSTGNPSIVGTKPILYPWSLRFQSLEMLQSAPATKRILSTEDITTYKIDGATGMSANVVMQENQIVTEFDIQIPYTVMSDGKEVMMDIQSHTLPASYSYYTTPKLDKDAFLMASITGWEKLNLLPGNSNVYLENSYVGEAFINPSITTDTLQLSFGRDKRIVVKREKVKDLNAVKFIGGNVEKDFMFETSIRNNKKENVTLTLEDQIPITTDQSIKIQDTELSNGNYTAETGLITWKIELKPGETKKVRLGYKVKYPKDRSIPGL